MPASDVALARVQLPSLVIAATVGFPRWPTLSTAYKVAEAEQALADGATELDMVLHYDALKQATPEQLKPIFVQCEAWRDLKGDFGN